MNPSYRQDVIQAGGGYEMLSAVVCLSSSGPFVKLEFYLDRFATHRSFYKPLYSHYVLQ